VIYYYAYTQTINRIRRDPTRVSQFVFNDGAEASLKSLPSMDSPTATPVKLSATMRFMLWCVDGMAGTVFMTVVTLWALFGDDIRLLTTERDMDSFFVDLTLFCLVCFVVELLFASIAKPQYFASFYFWLDGIATCSLVLDIPEVFEAFTGVSEKDSTLEYNDGDAMQGDAGNADAAKESATLTRAGRTSRAGTRAGRIVRLVRLVRCVAPDPPPTLEQKGASRVFLTPLRDSCVLSGAHGPCVFFGVCGWGVQHP